MAYAGESSRKPVTNRCKGQQNGSARGSQQPSSPYVIKEFSEELLLDRKIDRLLVDDSGGRKYGETGRPNAAAGNFRTFEYVHDGRKGQSHPEVRSDNTNRSKTQIGTLFRNIQGGVAQLFKIRSNSNCSYRDSKVSLNSITSGGTQTTMEPKQERTTTKATKAIISGMEEQNQKRRRRSSRTRSVERRRSYGSLQNLHGEYQHGRTIIYGDPEDLKKIGDNEEFMVYAPRISDEQIPKLKNTREQETVTESIPFPATPSLSTRSVQVGANGCARGLQNEPRTDGRDIEDTKPRARRRRRHRHRSRRRSKTEQRKHRKSSVAKTKKKDRRTRKKVPSDDEEENIPVTSAQTQMADLLNQPVRSPSQLLAEVLRSTQPGTKATAPRRRTLIPVPPPLIGLEEQSGFPRIIPLLASPELGGSSQGRLSSTKMKVQSTAKTMLELIRKFLNRKDSMATSFAEQKSFWLKDILEQNRAKNKAENKKYAVTFKWGFDKKPMRDSNPSLLESFIRKLKFGKDSPAAEVPLEEMDGLQYYHPWNHANHNPYFHQDHDMNNQNYILMPTPPINLDTSQVHQHQGELIARAMESTKASPVPLRPQLLSGIDLEDEDPVNRFLASRQRRATKTFQTYALHTVLESSSKVSEKTEALLQAAAAKSAGRLVSLASTSAPNAATPKASILNDDTLLKIYTPKTEFTKQFASLLPSHRGLDGF